MSPCEIYELYYRSNRTESQIERIMQLSLLPRWRIMEIIEIFEEAQAGQDREYRKLVAEHKKHNHRNWRTGHQADKIN